VLWRSRNTRADFVDRGNERDDYRSVGFDRQTETDVSNDCFPVRNKLDPNASNALSADRFAVTVKRPLHFRADPDFKRI
jgi:hypothetical protein